MKTDTLSFRLFAFTTLWMVVSLAIVAVLVSQDYRRTLENQFENLITANLYNLMGAIKRDDKGNLSGAPRLGDSRYQQYQSGWYWTVKSISEPSVDISSPSLAGLELSAPVNTGFDADFQRAYRLDDDAQNSLMIVEAQVFLGEGDDLYTFRATGNLAILDEEISSFRQRLIALFGLFGIGLIATSFLVVRYGLKPLRRATSQLAQIRGGKADRIIGKFPREIAPLIEETNALIKSNQAIVERSRTQVGNLAHSLKTPLSVLSLEAKNLPAPQAKKLRTQLAAMNSQVQSYLNRAMISARHGAITSRTNVPQTLVRLLRTFNKLFPDIEYSYTPSVEMISDFAGEQQDFEEIIGNILENAGNSAVGRVELTVRKTDNNSTPMIEIEIIDDGPGLSKSQIDYVLKRGNRLDENRPGTGLGLSIVSDILREYDGNLKLDTKGNKGLRAVVQLPAVSN